MSVTTEMAGATAIRPFHIEVPEEELDELRRRVRATRWPDEETVGDRSQGVQLAKLRPLVEYWGEGYDWRNIEAALNALPQFITEVDGLDIQFAHGRQGRPLRRLGAAAAVLRGGPSRIRITAQPDMRPRSRS